MSIPITKITRPIVRSIVPRKRLFRLLDSGRDAPVLWVKGPPGSGKTSLIASYIEDHKLPALWYQVDEGDADLATFFYYLGLAAKKAVPGRKKTLPLLTPEYVMGVPVFTLRFFEKLFSRLQPLSVVVFENFQDITSDCGFHDMIAHGLEVVPKGVTVIIISRRDPPLELSRLRANGKVRIIGWNELRLTPGETGEIVRMRGGNRITEGTLLRLHERTEGWIAGLILLLEQARQRDIEPEMMNNIAELSEESVFDYLAGEIFRKTDKTTQDFLLRTAFLPRMSAKISDKLAGIGHSAEMLADLSRDNFFTERHGGSPPVYNYHPLFRSFLLSRTRAVHTPEDIRSLQQTAAGLLEESGHIEDAAKLFIEAGDWDSLIRLICSHAPAVTAQGRNATLQQWISAIPQYISGQSPWILFWMGKCRTRFNLAEGRTYFEKAFALFSRKSDPAGEFLAWSGVVDSYIFEGADFKPLDHWIALMDELLSRHTGFPSPDIEARVAGSMFFALIYRNPQHSDFAVWEKRLTTLLHSHVDGRQRPVMGSSLVNYYLWIGDYAKASLLINELRPDERDQSEASMQLLMWWAVESIYLWFTGDFEGCIQKVAESLDAAHSSGVHVIDCLFLPQGAYAALSAGDVRTGADFLRRMKAVTNPTRLLDVSHIHFMAGWECALRNDLPHALEHARSAVAISGTAGALLPEAFGNIALAHTLMSHGEYPEALACIKKARLIGHEMKESTLLEFMGLLAEARHALERSEEQCNTLLQEAFALGREKGFVNHPWWLPQVMARLCARALEADIEVDYVQGLICKRGLFPDDPPSGMESWPWPLKIYTLGRFELVKDGAVVRFSGKVQQKPLAMLKFLIALGGKDVPQDQVIDTLWPDADGDMAHFSFKSNLHRLRQLVGNENVVRLIEGRLTLDPRYCWVDVEAFQDLSSRIKDAEGRDGDGAFHELARLRDKAIKLYAGDFLRGDAKLPWTIGRRERLKASVVRLIDRAGHSLEQSGSWKKAIECYEKAIEVNELHEEFYQRLMSCYLNQGSKAEALSVYHRCKRTLSGVLGIEPSPQTEAMHHKIKTTQ